MSNPLAEAQDRAENARRAVESAQYILDDLEQKRWSNTVPYEKIQEQRHIHRYYRQNMDKADDILRNFQKSTNRLKLAREKKDKAAKHMSQNTTAEMKDWYAAKKIHKRQEAISKAYQETPLPPMPGVASRDWLPLPRTPTRQSDDVWKDLEKATARVESLRHEERTACILLRKHETDACSLQASIEQVPELKSGLEDGSKLLALRGMLLEAHGAAQEVRIHITAIKAELVAAEHALTKARTAVELAEAEEAEEDLEAEYRSSQAKRNAKFDEEAKVVGINELMERLDMREKKEAERAREARADERWKKRRQQAEHKRREEERQAQQAKEARLQAEEAEKAKQEEALAKENARIQEVLDWLAQKQQEEARRQREEQREAGEKEKEKRRQEREQWHRQHDKSQQQDGQQSKPKSRPDTPRKEAQASPPPPPNHPIAVQQWRATTEALFADYSTMAAFPHPPMRHCGDVTCANAARALRACSHSIQAAVRSIPDLDVKKERLRWHPDRFSSCPKENRESFQKMAQEVFVVLDHMYQRR